MLPAFGYEIVCGIFDDRRQARTVAVLNGRIIAWVVWEAGRAGRAAWMERLVRDRGLAVFVHMLNGTTRWSTGNPPSVDRIDP